MNQDIKLNEKRPKIALVCIGVGIVWRGLERYTHDVFELLKNDAKITLFKGRGEQSKNEKTFPHFSRDGILSKVTNLPKYPTLFRCEQISYCLGLIPYLTLNGYSIVHYSEPGVGNILYNARKRLGLQYKLLYANGDALPPEHFARVDFIQQLTDPYYQQAIDYGISKEKVVSLPYGIHTDRFSLKKDKSLLKKKYDLPQDKTIVLSVAAINSSHKRIDYLVREMSKLDDNFFLLVCGNLEEKPIQSLAQTLLPNRHKFMTLPFEEVPNLYNLSDIFVHTALQEGFCLAIIEAMSSGLPVLAHASPHFKWLMSGDEGLIDMSQDGVLSSRLHEWGSRLANLSSMIERNKQTAIARFDWKNLKSRYLEMYTHLEAIS